jgi:hypothetical protein
MRATPFFRQDSGSCGDDPLPTKVIRPIAYD